MQYISKQNLLFSYCKEELILLNRACLLVNTYKKTTKGHEAIPDATLAMNRFVSYPSIKSSLPNFENKGEEQKQFRKPSNWGGWYDFSPCWHSKSFVGATRPEAFVFKVGFSSDSIQWNKKSFSNCDQYPEEKICTKMAKEPHPLKWIGCKLGGWQVINCLDISQVWIVQYLHYSKTAEGRFNHYYRVNGMQKIWDTYE